MPRTSLDHDLFEHAPDLWAAVDAQGRFLRANAAWGQALGCAPEVLEGQRIIRWVFPEDRRAVFDGAARARASGGVIAGDARLIHAGGASRLYEWRVRARAGAFCICVRDVTEARREEARLRRSLQRLEHLARLSGAGSWEVDLVENRIFWDDNTRAIHGVPDDYEPNLEEAINFYEPSARPVIQSQVERAITKGIPWVTELPLRTYSGARRVVRALGQPILENGVVVGLVGGFEDVTVRKAYEDELHRARLKAERSSVEKSQFLANMSHELRTPMAGVLGMLDALLDEPLDAELAFRAGVARDSANGLLAILNDILDYSKLEANEVQIEKLDFAPRALVKEVHAMFGPRAAEKSLALEVEIEAAVPEWVVSDPTRVRQILVNLVGNALKFTAEGRVRVEVVRIDRETVFRVVDTGLGLSIGQQQRLFRRFSQADTSTTRRFGGTGLGLAISKQLVQLLGGSIGVDSVEGQGSTFWFTVPSPEGSPPQAASEISISAPDAPLCGLRVLAAEDNRVNQMVLERALKKAGHDVELVENGEEALRALSEAEFDIVLMDIQMPVMDGLEATFRIRGLPGGPRIPIVALTANAMSGDRERYLAAGMDDYASKPIDRTQLAEAMARAIGKRHGAGPDL